MPASQISFTVEVLDGAALPVPDLEVGARFSYDASPSTWSTSTTDRDGRALFRDQHMAPPLTVCLFVSDGNCGTYPVVDGGTIVVEM